MLSSFSTVSIAASSDELSHSHYFEETHEWNDQSLDPMYSNVLVFIANEQAFADIYDLHYGFLYKKDLNTNIVSLLVDNVVTSYDLVNDRIFYSSGNQIISIDIDGNDSYVVMSENDNISSFIANDTLIYYVVNNALFRYHINSSTVDYVTSAVRIDGFIPLSNVEVVWWVENNAETGESGCLYTYFNTLSGEEFIVEPYSWEHTQNEGIAIAPMAAAVYTVNGKTIPNSSYLDGSYFTSNGSACGSCHNLVCVSTCTTCNDKTNSDKRDCNCGHAHKASCNKKTCNCKTVNGAIQCYGFAYCIYNYLFGNYGTKVTLSQTISTEAEAKAFAQTLCAGAHIRAKNDGHSMIFVSMDAAGVVVYEANTGGTDQVTLKTFTYAQLKDKLGKLTCKWTIACKTQYILKGASGHTTCGNTGCYYYNVLAPHVTNGTPGPNATCYSCGYVGTINIGIASTPLDEH